MYLIAIHVPIYQRGNDLLLATDWKRSLELLRDSFDGRFGHVYVVAPSLDASLKTDQALEVVDSKRDGIYLNPSFPLNTRARDYCTRYRQQWLWDVNRLAAGARVVHAGFDDCYRPMMWDGFQLGVRHDKPTVFVQDTDHVGQIETSLPSLPLGKRAEQFAYKTIFERAVRQGVGQAALSLLKGQDLHRRYGAYAANAHNFHDTSYFSSEIAPKSEVLARNLSLLAKQRPVRFVYCGRLEARKGVDHSIGAIARARQLGASVTLDIIGDGAERATLEGLTSQLGANEAVRFLGQQQYGSELLRKLSGYDALLFTPQYEDTPRMIFDGYAAGLPLVAYNIPYVQERLREDHCVCPCPVNDIEAMAQILAGLSKNRNQLTALAPMVHEAAKFYAADTGYKMRANLTIDAVTKYRSRRAA